MAVLYTSHYFDEVERLCDRVDHRPRAPRARRGSPAEVVAGGDGTADLQDLFLAVTGQDLRGDMSRWAGPLLATLRLDLRRWRRQRLAALTAVVAPAAVAVIVTGALGGEPRVDFQAVVDSEDGGPANGGLLRPGAHHPAVAEVRDRPPARPGRRHPGAGRRGVGRRRAAVRPVGGPGTRGRPRHRGHGAAPTPSAPTSPAWWSASSGSGPQGRVDCGRGRRRAAGRRDLAADRGEGALGQGATSARRPTTAPPSACSSCCSPSASPSTTTWPTGRATSWTA